VISVSAAKGYALWAETWDTTQSPVVAVERRGLSPWIAGLRPKRAVDIGCGTGRWTREFDAIGLDLSAEMLGRAVGLRGKLVQADAAVLPIASGACDLVICALALAHLPNPEEAWREFARILQPGGVLLLSDFHPEAVARGWRRTFRRDGIVYDLEHHAYTLDHLRAAAPDLHLAECGKLTIGEPERHLFVEAGRPNLFEEACRIPAVQISRWTRV